MQKPTVTQGEQLVFFNKEVQREHVPCTFIPEGQSHSRLTQGKW